ncbi:hypothetical protein BSNK01_00970 [Bacillaceae bacterium]
MYSKKNELPMIPKNNPEIQWEYIKNHVDSKIFNLNGENIRKRTKRKRKKEIILYISSKQVVNASTSFIFLKNFMFITGLSTIEFFFTD